MSVHRLVCTLLAAMVLIAGLPLAGAAQAYVLGPGDVIEVSVFGNRDVSRVVTIRPDGFISLPLIGEVKAAGLTPEELRNTLTQMFARYIKDPKVSVIVQQFRRLSVTVLGQVARPGVVDLPQGATILDAIAVAGGLTENASLTSTKLLRGQAPPVSVNLERILIDGDAAANLRVETGDTIVIDADFSARFFVLGEVARPGVYPLRTRTTVVQALTGAGGPTRSALLSRAWIVRRGPPSSQPGGKLPPGMPAEARETSPGVYVIPIDVAKMLREGDLRNDIELQRGDVLFIPENLLTFQNVLLVLGVIARVLNFFPGP